MRFFKFSCLMFLMFSLLGNAKGGTYVVTNTNDAGAGSLRQAMTSANADASAAIINFAIPGVGPYTINLQTQLPEMTNTNGITINGATQASSGVGSGEQKVIVYAQGSTVLFGFVISTIPATIKGLTIRNFPRSAVYVYQSNNVTVSQNEVDGMNIAGSLGIDVRYSTNVNVLENKVYHLKWGIYINYSSSINANNNSVTENTEHGIYIQWVSQINCNYNISSRNGYNGISVDNAIAYGTTYNGVNIEYNTIENNGTSKVGLDYRYRGYGRIANNFISGNGYGIQLSCAVPNGGAVEIEGNTIVSNIYYGVRMSYIDGITIKSNFIGTDINNSVKGNGYGLILDHCNQTTIGGSLSTRNIIANNTQVGIQIAGGNRNLVTFNKIYDNGSGKAIDLFLGAAGSEGNSKKKAPIITGINTFTISGTAEANDKIHVYYNNGPAQNALGFIGETVANGSGVWSLKMLITPETYVAAANNNIVATATDAQNNTSELSTKYFFNGCVVTTTQDNGSNTAPTVGSLRAAINCANTSSAQGQVLFALPGEGPYYFNVNVQLPNLNNPKGIVIDGSSQIESRAGIGEEQKIVIKGVEDYSISHGLNTTTLGKKNQIKNLEISNFGYGIALNSSENAVTNVKVSKSTTGILITGAATNCNVKDCDISICNVGIFSNSGKSFIQGNQIFETEIYGIQLQGKRNSILDNYIGLTKDGVSKGYTFVGLGVQLVDSSLIRNNVIGNAIDYFDQAFGIQGSLINSTIDSNYIGVSKDGAILPVRKGIFLQGDYYNQVTNLIISNNFISNCSEEGLKVINGTSLQIGYNYFGTDKSNRVFQNGTNGIFLQGTQGVQLESNHIVFHTGDGIVIKDDSGLESKRNLLTKNIISNNGSGSKAINLFYTASNEGNEGELQPIFNNNPTVDGSNNLLLTGTSSPNRKIELFKGASSYQSAIEYIGSTTADGSGNWSYTIPNIPQVRLYFAATATDVTITSGSPKNNTSELSTFSFCNAATIAVPTFTIKTFCPGKAAVANMESILQVNNPAAGLTYEWVFNNDNTHPVITQSTQQAYTFKEAGSFPVLLTAKNACYTNSSTGTVDVMEFKVKTPKAKLCKGEETDLTVVPGNLPVSSYIWYRNNTKLSNQGPTLHITEPDKYIVIIKDLSCVSSETEYDVPPGAVGAIPASIGDVASNRSSVGSEDMLSSITAGGNVAYATIFVIKKICPEIGCGSCISTFRPEPNKEYVVSAWVKEDVASNVDKYENAEVHLKFHIDNGNNSISIDNTSFPTAKVVEGTPFVDGWQKIEKIFTVPANTIGVTIELKSSSETDIYYDDVRIQPFNSTMKSYVYDPVDLRLMSELDERNNATFYEYDQEGKLIRIKKETERGIMTIQESQNNTFKSELDTNP